MPTVTTEEVRSPKELLYIEILKDNEKYVIYLKSEEIAKITKNLFKNNTTTVGEHNVYWNEHIAHKILRKIYGWGSSFTVEARNNIISVDGTPNLIPLMDTKLGNGVKWEISLSDILITKREINIWTSELERIAKFLYNTYGEEYKKTVRIMIETT
jgi:hypothetical protein